MDAPQTAPAPSNARLQSRAAATFSCFGMLLIVVPFMPWASWSPARGADLTTGFSTGAGPFALALAAIGLVMAVMGFQAITTPVTLHLWAMLFASVVALVTAVVVATDRLHVTSRLANALLSRSCISGCGSADALWGPGLYASVAVSLAAVIVALFALAQALDPW